MMEFVDNSIIVCPSNVKSFLIKKFSINNPSLRVKFFTKNEILDGLYYSYDDKALLYLVKRYSFSYENAQEFLDNITHISGNLTNENMLNIYNDLLNNNLLYKNDAFNRHFINKKVYVISYSKEDFELNKALSSLSFDIEYVVLDDNEYTHNVYKFDNIEKELRYVTNQLGKLINNGVPLNKIYFYTFDRNYSFELKKILLTLNIPNELFNDETLKDSVVFKKYISFLDALDYETAYEHLVNEVNENYLPYCRRIKNIMIEIKNVVSSKEEFIEVLIYKANKIKVPQLRFEDSLKLCDYNSLIDDDEYVFVLGFSLANFPVVHQDRDFFSDKEKKNLGLNTTKILNNIEINRLTYFLKNTKNIILTMSNVVGGIEQFPSLLVDNKNLILINGVIDNVRFSKELAYFECAEDKDQFTLYKEKGKYLNAYEKEEMEYCSYSHLFKPISSWSNKIKVFSYTSLNSYSVCPFYYFVNYVLGLNKEFEATLQMKIGNLFHMIIEHDTYETFNINKYQDYINSEFKTGKEKFFVNLLIEKIPSILLWHKDFSCHTQMNEFHNEKELKMQIELDKNEFTIYGKVDKLYLNTQAKYYSIVDYKTGNFNFDSKFVECGLNMQLPIYMMLLHYNYKNYKFIGSYIQNVLDYKNVDYLKFHGLSIDKYEDYRFFDPSFDMKSEDGEVRNNKSLYVKSVGLNKDGTLKGGKKALVDASTVTYFINKAEEFASSTIQNINQGNFEIKPKNVKGKTMQCSFCKYHDICFVKLPEDENYINLNDKEEEESTNEGN
ncbi:MAG: PD-(D/E)XK nuclease family protein [Bacilli bacterium]